MIAISVAATRIHRSLTEFAASPTYTLCDTTLFSFFPSAHSVRHHRSPRILDSSRSAVSSADRARSTVTPVPVPLKHMEVAVHKTYNRYEVAPTRHHVSFVVAGEELHNKPIAGPLPDIEKGIISAETRPTTDAAVKSAQTSNTTGTKPQDSARRM